MTMPKNVIDGVYWYTLRKPSPAVKLTQDHKTEVVVVGGGMAGLTLLQTLRQANVDAVLVEKDFCGAGASGKSSGFITPDSELELTDMVENYGRERGKRLWDFVTSGVERIRKNIRDFNIACDYQVQDSLFIANDRKGFKKVEEEYRVRQEMGYGGTLYQKTELPRVIGSQGYSGAVRYAETFGIVSYLYCQALRDILAQSGAKIYEGMPVEKVEKNSVVAGGRKISANAVAVCTDRFLPDLGLFKTEVYHAQTFLSISRPLSDREVRDIFPQNKLMVWDTDMIYQYYRITGDNRLLIGGGDILHTYARNETHPATKAYRTLKRYLKQKFPQVDVSIESIWPGLIGVSKDFLPVAGMDEGVYVMGGAAGLPWAAALGDYIAQKITTGRSDFDEDFSPGRKFPVGPRLQKLTGTKLAFALSHGVTKYI